MAKQKQEVQYLIEEFKLHNSPAWLREIVEHLRVSVSVIVARTLARLQSELEVTWLENKKIRLAVLKLTLPDRFRARIENLMDPDRMVRGKRAGDKRERPPYNSYGFIGLEDSEHEGMIRATVRLLERVPTGEQDKKGNPKFRKEAIAVTTGLQQLIQSFVNPAGLELLPKELQAGVVQEVAQQLMSHIQLADSGEVAEANFPTVEDRDPEQRLEVYRGSLTRSGRKPHQFVRKPYKELHPERFARLQKTGPAKLVEKLEKRLLIADEDWDAVRRKPFPPQIPLLFATSAACQVFRGEKEVDSAVSKSDVCRGIDKAEDAKHPIARTAQRRMKPIRLHKDKWVKKTHKAAVRGKMKIRPYHLALPLVNGDPVVSEILRRRDSRIASQHHKDGKSGRGWDFNLKSVPMWGEEDYRPHTGRRKVITRRVLIPLEFGDQQKRSILDSTKITPCWSRLVMRGGELFWQLTYKVGVPPAPDTKRVLGVHFGMNRLHWQLLNEKGEVEQTGTMRGNPHLRKHLQSADDRSWDQKKGRWIGGRVNQKALKTATYSVVGRLIALAKSLNARLCVEDINWVSKKSSSAPINRRFSGWNYGKLRRFLEYKGPLLGLGKVLLASDYVVNLQCPECGAIRQKGQKKDNADTYYDVKTSTLSCRKCEFEGEKSADQKALNVARWGYNLLAQGKVM